LNLIPLLYSSSKDLNWLWSKTTIRRPAKVLYSNTHCILGQTKVVRLSCPGMYWDTLDRSLLNAKHGQQIAACVSLLIDLQCSITLRPFLVCNLTTVTGRFFRFGFMRAAENSRSKLSFRFGSCSVREQNLQRLDHPVNKKKLINAWFLESAWKCRIIIYFS